MWCRRNPISGRYSLSLTMENIYLSDADRIKYREGRSLVDDEEQNHGAQKNEMPGRHSLYSLKKNNYAVWEKSIAGQAKSIIDDNEQF